MFPNWFPSFLKPINRVPFSILPSEGSQYGLHTYHSTVRKKNHHELKHNSLLTLSKHIFVFYKTCIYLKICNVMGVMFWNSCEISGVIKLLDWFHHFISWRQSSFPRKKLCNPLCLWLKERESYQLHYSPTITKLQKKIVNLTNPFNDTQEMIYKKTSPKKGYLSRNAHKRERRRKRWRKGVLVQRSHSVIVHNHHSFGVKKRECIWIPTQLVHPKTTIIIAVTVVSYLS